jgi:MFS family permease
LAATEPWRIVWILAVTQIVSWGSLYYAFAILAPDVQREFGWSPEIVFGAYSWSLLITGVVSTPAGMLLDRIGGRAIMGVGSLLAGVGLIFLSLAANVVHYFAAWTLLGFAMALVLYEAAFATINREFVHSARKGISALTLFGGLASTVFWPITLHLNNAAGWRKTYLVYGLIHLALCLPLHALLRKGRPRMSVADPANNGDGVRSHTLHEALRDPTFWKLAFAFSTNAFVFSSMSVHLIPLLHKLGHSLTTAVLAATLIGPMQVAGRIGEMALAHRLPPQRAGTITFAVLPAALLALIFFGAHEPAIALFCILYGLSNGVMTIVRGTVPIAMFGRDNYGAVSGALASPATIAKAAGPIVIATVVALGPSPYPALAVLLSLSLLSLGCYLAVGKATRRRVEIVQP